MIGKTISHYKIIEKIGEGGMGEVYLAGDLKLERKVALKFLPQHLTTDRENVERFEREAKAAAALNHPNIVTIHEISKEDDQTFIVMEYVDGESLRTKLDKCKLDIDEVIDITQQICEGLGKANQAGIVHRDIKPENILINTDGRVKILDFGLAKLKGVSKLTKETSTLGTVHYMSPEQIQGKDVDHRSDIWSLGIVLYEMLTGETPFVGDYEQAIGYAILNEEPKFVESIPSELQNILKKALNKNPEERYQDTDELVLNLKGSKSEYSETKIKEVILKKRFKSVLIPIFVLSILVLIVIGYFLVKPDDVLELDWQNSIAVLPFDNLSNDPEQEYFCDGITEDIIAHLSKINNLKVISRTSIMQYKDVKKKLPEIANELNVKMILEGTVRRAGDRVRIVAQLIEAGEDKHLWSEIYDRELSDIFEIQSDVAEKIAGALRFELSDNEKALIKKKQTEDFAAYNYYKKGRELYYRYQKEDNLQAIRMYKKALETDPNYALAYAGLGDAYAMGYSRFGYSRIGIDSALIFGKKAIDIDPKSSEGYKALGAAYSVIDRVKPAINAYKKSIELNPGNDMAVGNLGYRYLKKGQLKEALKWNLKKIELNPVSATGHVQLGIVYTSLCEDTKAQSTLLKALDLDPKMAAIRNRLIDIYLVQEDYLKALTTAKEILIFSPDTLNAFTYTGYVEHVRNNTSEAYKYFTEVAKKLQEKYFYDHYIISMLHLGAIELKRGNIVKAKKIFSEFLDYANKEISLGNESWELPYNIAGVYSVLGDLDKGIEWLDRTIDAGWRNYRIAEIEPLFKNIKQDSRFEKRIAHVKELVNKAREQIKAAEK